VEDYWYITETKNWTYPGNSNPLD